MINAALDVLFSLISFPLRSQLEAFPEAGAGASLRSDRLWFVAPV